MNAVALSAGKHTYFLLLFGTAEIKAAAIGAAVHHRSAGELHEFPAASNRLVYSLFGLEFTASLVDVTELHRLADSKLALKRF